MSKLQELHDRYEDLEFLLSMGESPEEAMKRCGFHSAATVMRWAYRNNNEVILSAFKKKTKQNAVPVRSDWK